MATFNLQDYETVEERIKRFYADHPTGRIITDLIEHDQGKGIWVCKSYVFRNDSDIDPAATGLAFEIDGQGMANKTSALENAETSSIGRALANMNYSRKKRASLEEVSKVQRATTAKPSIASDDATWLKLLDAVETLEQARELYKSAQKSASQKVLAAITIKADTLK